MSVYSPRRIEFVSPTIRRRAILTALGLIAVGKSWAQTDQIALLKHEKALQEKLLDLAAVVRSGSTLSDYKRHVDEVVILEDRYIRNGGASRGLAASVYGFKQSAEDWEKLNKRRLEHATDRDAESSVELTRIYLQMEGDQEGYMQKHWANADQGLKDFETELASRRAASNGRKAVDRSKAPKKQS